MTQVGQFDGNDNVGLRAGHEAPICSTGGAPERAAVFYTDFTNRPTTIGGAEATLDSNLNVVPGNQQLISLPWRAGWVHPVQQRQTLPGNTGITLHRPHLLREPAGERAWRRARIHGDADAGADDQRLGGLVEVLVAGHRRAHRESPQNNPFYTANAGIQYQFAADALGGPITPRLDWTYESSQIVSGTSTKYNYLMPHAPCSTAASATTTLRATSPSRPA